MLMMHVRFLLMLALLAQGAQELGLAGERLHRWDTVRAGYERVVGNYTLTTLATTPAVFAIDDFLSADECERIISVANGTDGVMADSSSQRWRNSRHGWVRTTGPFGKRLRQRASLVAQLPAKVLQESEPMQIVAYKAGGHYHAHHDSTPPRTARFATLLVFLTTLGDKGGGELAFPRAAGAAHSALCHSRNSTSAGCGSCNSSGSCFTALQENLNLQHNLSSRSECTRGLTIAPRRGRAVLFYNHLEANASHLGAVDTNALHGGCDVLPGAHHHKWIANIWFNIPGESTVLEQKRRAVEHGTMSAQEVFDELGHALARMQTMTYEEQVAFVEEYKQHNT